MRKADEITSWIMENPFVTKDHKEEWDALRFLLHEKMFAMLCCNKEGTPILTVKLPPQVGAFYRENFAFITEGYYMNKVHWISISYQEVEDALVLEIIKEAYGSFYATLPLKIRNEWEA